MALPCTARSLLSGIALVGLVGLVYLPGLGGGFLFDDYQNIVHQPAIRMEALTWAALTDALSAFRHGIGRPIPMLSFALDHLVWGRDPFGYKLSSVAVHAINAALVFALCHRLIRLLPPPGARQPFWTAGAIALVWALHPLQVSTTLYVVQRMEMLSLTFTLLALLAYLAGRTRQREGRRAWPYLAWCPPLVALGLACKETAALFPAYAIALELSLLGFRAATPAQARAIRHAHVAALAGLALVALLLAPYLADETRYAIRDYDAMDRMLTQLRVVPMYLGWILLPRPGAFTFYYDNYPVSTSLLEPIGTLWGGAFLVLLAASALLLRRRSPLFALGTLWFLASHAITSSYLPLELVFEHRNYFSILGVALAVYGLLRMLPEASPRAAMAALAALAIGLGTLTAIRTATWGNPLHLAMQLAQANPGSARASTHLGDEYVLVSRITGDPLFQQLAEKEYERGAALPGASPMPEHGLLLLAASTGRPAKSEWWDSALAKLRSRAIGPQEMAMITSLLDLRVQGQPIDDDRLAEAYVLLVNRMQVPPTQHFAFGLHALVHLGDKALADQLFALAVDHAPDNPQLVEAMVKHLERQGHAEAAGRMRSHARAAAGDRGGAVPGTDGATGSATP